MPTSEHTFVSKLSEAKLQELVRDSEKIQEFILDNLGYEFTGSERFVREVQYINGIRVDFKIVKDGKVVALMECKRGDIGVTDYVRGIGQLMQYEYFKENDIITGEPYSDDFKTVYFIPSDIIKNPNFNIGTFKYPESTQIIEINVDNYLVRTIADDELQKLSTAKDGKAIISQYYFRDNRFYELYILLQYLQYLSIKESGPINRSRLEEQRLRLLETPNNRNWRNAFITLSTLGFINNGNHISDVGYFMARKSYAEFCYELYKSYAKVYIDLILRHLKTDPNISMSDLATRINNEFGDKKVLFVTDSDNRYLSSWLNIMRDDYNCIRFASRSNERNLIYNPGILNKEAFIQKIESNTEAQKYIKYYKELIREGRL